MTGQSAVYEVVNPATHEVLCEHRSRKAAIHAWHRHYPSAPVEVWRRGSRGDVLVAEGVAPTWQVRRRQRTQLAVTAWILSVPVVWVVFWFFGLVMVDENSSDLGGAGPDTFDFIDIRLVAAFSIATLAAWAIALVWVVRRLNSGDEVPIEGSPSHQPHGGVT